MSTPRLTVITVCRNARAALERTTASVLDRQRPGLEYWIVDGASTDGTRDDLEALARSHAVRFVSERDGGIADAMNKGVRLATGEWVAHLHAGDTYLPGALDRVLAAIDAGGADVLCGWLIKEEAVGETLYRADPARLPYEMTINHPATVLRRSLFEQCGGFDPAYPNAMDYEFFLRLARAGARFAVIDTPLARMAWGGQSERSLARTLAETRDIRRRHHSPRWYRSQAFYLWLVMRAGARQALQRLGLGALVAWWRQHLSWPRKG